MEPDTLKIASQKADKYILRFQDEGLRKQLKVRAALNERTLNAEIIYLVKLGIEADGLRYGAAA